MQSIKKTSHLVACGRLRVLTSCQIMMVSAAVTPAMTCDQLSEVSSYNHSDFTIEINHQSIGYGTAWFYTSLRRCFYCATAIAIMSVCLFVYHVPELYRKVLIHVYHNTFSAYGTQPFCFPTTKYLRISDGITPYGGGLNTCGVYTFRDFLSNLSRTGHHHGYHRCLFPLELPKYSLL